MRILMVEEAGAPASRLLHLLAQKGYAIDRCSGCAEAIGHLCSGEHELILVDGVTPAGLEICRRHSSDGLLVPVLVLTAGEAVRDRVAALEAGADDVLVKPFAVDELVARIKALLRRAKMMAISTLK
jgi:DNA-binding response OmpR family regulator